MEAKSWNFIAIMVLLIVVGIASQFVVMQRMDMASFMREQMAQSRQGENMTSEEIDQAVEMQMKFVPIMGYIAPPIAVPIASIIIAFFLWLAFMATGGSAKFVGCWRVFTWAQIPPVLKAVLFWIISYVKEPNTMDIANPIATNPAAFLVREDVAKPLYAVLSRLDIFSLWMLFLLIVGMSAESKKSKGLSAAVVIGLWLITVVIHGSGRSGSSAVLIRGFL